MISSDRWTNWMIIRAKKVSFSSYHRSLAAYNFDVLASNRPLNEKTMERLREMSEGNGISIKTEDWSVSTEDEDEIIKRVFKSKKAYWLEKEWNKGG